MKIEVYSHKLSAVLYGCENWYVMASEEHG